MLHTFGVGNPKRGWSMQAKRAFPFLKLTDEQRALLVEAFGPLATDGWLNAKYRSSVVIDIQGHVRPMNPKEVPEAVAAWKVGAKRAAPEPLDLEKAPVDAMVTKSMADWLRKQGTVVLDSQIIPEKRATK
jgi:hypothetical protein